jgi:chemotaxis protein methyltransferase WspC
MKSLIQVEPEIIARIVARLGEVAGIDPASLEAGRIAWTVERRCRHLRLTEAAAYAEYLASNADELEELIDALVIQETRFFRDPAVFEHLRAWAREAASAGHGSLRVLSAPCSTGQEAYSIAATLTLAGIAPSRFTIDAFDISNSALATARRGVYAAGSLQHAERELQEACGRLQGGHWHMHEELRRRIRFERRNLAEPDALESGEAYHLILCRNLFIYLNARARAALADSLSRALAPDGRLIVGAGDRVAELNARFVPVKPAAGFGFTHKPQHAPAKVLSVVQAAQPKRQPPELSLPVQQWQGEAVPLTAAEFYRRAMEFKERGNVRQAERRCRQALYLAPEFLPALELLQALWHVHPNARLRRALNSRIQRVRTDTEAASVQRVGETP